MKLKEVKRERLYSDLTFKKTVSVALSKEMDQETDLKERVYRTHRKD